MSEPVADRRKLVEFLYLLLREHLPFGRVESLVQECERDAALPHRDRVYRNGHAARHAIELAERLRDGAAPLVAVDRDGEAIRLVTADGGELRLTAMGTIVLWAISPEAAALRDRLDPTTAPDDARCRHVARGVRCPNPGQPYCDLHDV